LTATPTGVVAKMFLAIRSAHFKRPSLWCRHRQSALVTSHAI